jgi:hypothetical protein
LQLAPLVERMTRNFGEKRLTGAVFLDVDKAFDTVWIDDLLHKLTLLNFPSYIVHTLSTSLVRKYVSNRQIHEDLGVPLFTDQIRALPASFLSKLSDVGNPIVRHLGRYLR